MSFASELNAAWGSKKVMAFIPDTVFEILSHLESKLSSDVVQSQSPTTRLPSELGMLRERERCSGAILRGGTVTLWSPTV